MSEKKQNPEKRISLLDFIRIVFFVLIALFFMVNINNSINKPKDQEILIEKKMWTPPSLYTASSTIENINYGYRWLNTDDYNCSLFQSCIALEIVSSQNCNKGFSVQAVILDKTGANIGSTHNSLQIVSADERSKIILPINISNSAQSRIAEASCLN